MKKPSSKTAASTADAALSTRKPPASAPELSLSEVASGILARTLRPRVAQLRQLAQAVLDTEAKRAKRKAKEEGKKKGGGKKRKLAKIPARKKRT
jgi:hypothetical protein